MAESMSLMEFLQELVGNTGLRDRFAHDPQAALHQYGLDDLSPADVHDALVLVEDNQTADFSRDHAVGHDAIQVPPPPVPRSYAAPADVHHAAVSYLNTYISTNHVDERSSTVDNPVNQQVGSFDQDIDVHPTGASGGGAVAAGGDIRGSTITTGGRGGAGHDSATAFGSGAATSTDVGHDVAVGGSAAADDSGSPAHDVGTTHPDSSIDDSPLNPSDHDSGSAEVDAGTHDSFTDNGEHHVGTIDAH